MTRVHRALTVPGLLRALIVALSVLGGATDALAANRDDRPIQLRVAPLPGAPRFGPIAEAEQHVLQAFRARYPRIEPVTPTSLQIPGATRTQDMVPFMQIAGDIAPDVLYVSFRQSQ